MAIPNQQIRPDFDPVAGNQDQRFAFFAPNSPATVDLFYTTSDNDNTLTGVGFFLHYNSSQVSFNSVTNLLTTNNFAPGIDEADTDNRDRDTTTDRRINFTWADFGGNFPNVALPTRLATVTFTTSATFSSSSFGFSPNSGASGYGGFFTPAILNNNVANTAGTLQFSASTFTIAENGTPVNAVTVTRTGGSTGEVRARVSYSGDGTAKLLNTDPPSANPNDPNTPDFTSLNTIEVIFADGDSTAKTVTIPIANDAVLEGTQTAGLALISPIGGATIGAQSLATLNIIEPGTIQFSAPTFSFNEDGTAVNVVTVTRTGGSSGAIGATIALADGPATNATGGGVDYTSTNIAVNFADGDSANKTFIVPIIQDTIDEPNENFTVTLGTPTGGVAIGAQNTATVAIIDDDLPSVSIAATDANASEVGPDNGLFTITRVGQTNAALTVNYVISGTATNGSDYTTIAATAVIPANQPSVTVSIAPILDAIADPAETVILTLTPELNVYDVTGGAATVTIADAPIVTVAAQDANASELGPDTGTYRISRTGATTSALTVNFSITGTATNGTDYTNIASSAIIPVGQSFVDVVLTPAFENSIEGSESAILTISANPAAYAVGAANSATITIADAPVVTVVAQDANAAEIGSDTGTYRISRSGDTTAALSVNYGISGSATNGTDYNTLTSPAIIPAGQSFVDVVLTPILDSSVEGSEDAILTISANPATYAIGAANTATIAIVDAPTVSVTAQDANASELGSDTGTYRISRTGATTSALNVNIALSGTASNGTDYNNITSPVTIPAGQSFVDVVLTPILDTSVEGSEDAVLTITANNAAYVVGTANTATVSIADAPVVTVTAQDANASELGSDTGTYRISRTGSTTSALTVNFGISGSATNGTDYNNITSSAIIPAGQLFVDVVLTPVLDNSVEGSEDAILTISANNTAYAVGAANSATVTIADAPVVTVTAQDANASEIGADTGTYRISRTGSTTSALNVNFALSGSATNGTDYNNLASPAIIPAGAAFVDVVLTPIVDANNAEGTETAILTLTANNALYALGGTIAATVNIADSLPQVSITATDATAAEAGPDAGQFTVTRTGETTAALTVNYVISGSATNGTDYNNISVSSITIPIGLLSVPININPILDSLTEGSETAIITLSANSAYVLGTTTATVNIADASVITVSATDATASEIGLETGTFRITRAGGDQSASLNVNIGLTGSATNGTDYTNIASPAIIAAGAAFVDVVLTPLADLIGEGPETAILAIAANNAAYAVGAPNTATINIQDNLPTVTLSLVDGVASEAGLNNSGTYRITRTGDTTSALVVNFGLGGTATPGIDHNLSATGTATILAGQASVDVNLIPFVDALVEGNETAILTLTANTALYFLGGTVAQTVNIADFTFNPPNAIGSGVISRPTNGGNLILGSNGNNQIVGGLGADTVAAFAGDDEIYVLSGNDSVDGGFGNDTVYGNAGNDTLIGNIGNDILIGTDFGTTTDIDRLVGGTGADVFVLGSTLGNFYLGTTDFAAIADFAPDDVIQVQNPALIALNAVSLPAGFSTGTTLSLGGNLIAVVQGSSPILVAAV